MCARALEQEEQTIVDTLTNDVHENGNGELGDSAERDYHLFKSHPWSFT